MAGPTESLFSLEIVVDCVEKSLVCCHVPAIAFRLLDFPTLIIRSDEKESPNYLNGFYPIQSGKSCLFKMSKEMLLSRLQSTPLYIMLVDISPNKTKLLASTTISLTNCFENVLESIQRNGLDVPAVHGRQGVFELYNLMGTQVASVKLTYRMFSLGGTINGHVQQCISSAENLNKGDDSRRKEDPRKKGQTSNHDQIIKEDFGVKDSEDEKDSGNGKETEISSSNLPCEVETQTYICNKDDIILDAKSTVGLKENVNITRPPPLYYNSQSTVAHSKAPLQRYRTSSSEKNIDKVFKQTPEKTYKTVAIQTSCSGQRNAEVVNIPRIENDERAQLADLPLINALLSELSLAKQSWMNTAAHTNNNNRVLPTTTHTQDTIPVLVLQPNKKSLKQKEKVEVPSNRKPILKARPTKPVTKGVLIQRNYTKLKKSSLKCGTTKTQKLREALNKKTSHSNDLSLCNIVEEKRPLNSQDLKKNKKTQLVASEMKETREFGCEVPVTCSDEQGTSENEQKSMPLKTNHDEQLTNIVERNDDLLPVSGQTYSKDIVPSSSKFDSFKVGIADDPTQDDHDDINKLLNLTAPTLQDQLPPASDLELSSHSKKSSTSSAYTISQGSVKPTFSNFSPTRAKNARYSNDEWSNKAKSTDSASSGGESGLVGKPINQLSFNSSSEHNYSDNFDSLASEHSDN